MHDKKKRFFKHKKTSVLIDALIVENDLVSVIPEAPTAHQKGLLEADNILSSLSINKHFNQIHICIPRQFNFVPESFTEIAFEEKMCQTFNLIMLT